MHLAEILVNRTHVGELVIALELPSAISFVVAPLLSSELALAAHLVLDETHELLVAAGVVDVNALHLDHLH